MISDSILVTESVFIELVTQLVTELVTRRGVHALLRPRASAKIWKFPIFDAIFHYKSGRWEEREESPESSPQKYLVTSLVTQLVTEPLYPKPLNPRTPCYLVTGDIH